MSKEPLLFLCHRIPYPPNKGDKIRSFNILKELSQHYDIHLGSLVDDPHDWQYQDVLNKYCKDVFLRPLSPLWGKLKGLFGMLLGKPISLTYFHDRQLQAWVSRKLAGRDIRKVFLYSSAMCGYVESQADLHRVADFVDVDSDKWRQYAEKATNPLMKAVYRFEAKALAAYEQRITQAFDAVSFVSGEEAGFFARTLPAESANKVFAFPNGVDTEFFNPSLVSTSPFNSPYLVFTGAMDYWANVDAVVWFASKVWPAIHKQHPQLQFAIVGGNPTDKVKQLANTAGVVVTGRVEDIRPYITHALFAVAPLRIARGIQNKVLEAMALNKTVVMTQMAAEGIQLPSGQLPLIHDEANAFTDCCLQLLNSPEKAQETALENLHWIRTHYQWQAVMDKLIEKLNDA
ncbi:TIGR03087 family PEP-CTERM/XrtA system glycosyltransferase [Bowmanella denitrificans]|uniref:TIGR03087 family PEP-CTERM/XrtA system glycosyltransferase n=1 Tax=Bowmanella denitrificans TaxID=366582 RepID=A0ABP3HH32_9ALTE